MPLPRKDLAAALAGTFDAITFDRMLSDYLNIRRERLVAATGNAGLDTIISTIVDIADEGRFVIDLIRAALTASPGSPQLRQFVVRNPDYDPGQQPDPQTYVLSMFMRGRRVFCKRDEFRRRLQQIGARNESRV